MVYLALFLALVLLPTAAIIWFRASGTAAFLSLCLGVVLTQYVAPEVTDTLVGFFGANRLLTTDWVKMGLLVAPVVLAILFTARSAHGTLRKVVNVVSAAATGMLFALFMVVLLPKEVQAGIKGEQVYKVLNNLQTAVILKGAFFGMLYLYLTKPKHEGKKDKKK